MYYDVSAALVLSEIGQIQDVSAAFVYSEIGKLYDVSAAFVLSLVFEPERQILYNGTSYYGMPSYPLAMGGSSDIKPDWFITGKNTQQYALSGYVTFTGYKKLNFQIVDVGNSFSKVGWSVGGANEIQNFVGADTPGLYTIDITGKAGGYIQMQTRSKTPETIGTIRASHIWLSN